MVRRHAVASYGTDHTGLVDVHHDLEEIADLHQLIELGPHWDTIAKIAIDRI